MYARQLRLSHVLQRNLSHRFKSSVVADARTNATTATKSVSSNASVPLGLTVAAAVSGVAVVSAVAAMVENTADVPIYDPKGQRFDEANFKGRFSRMLLACDPRLLLYTQEEVLNSKHMIDNYENYKGMDRELWEARRISESALHPDTGEFIPRPFRMSGYVCYNGPICVSMVASTNTPALLFWSWANQSQNALVNYYNRNASSPMTNETLGKSYAAAVGSALLVAFGLATVIQKRYSPEKAKALLKYVAFPSAVVASSLNCYIVRAPEMDTGVPLVDGNGNNVLEGATSKEAARRGVLSTTASRALLQAPVYFVPPVLLSFGPLHKIITRSPRAAVPLTTGLVLVAFGLGLPATVAVFPQMAAIPAAETEAEFQHLRDPATGKPYSHYYYNKGL